MGIEKEMKNENEKDIQNETEQVQESPVTMEQPANEDTKPEENLKEAEVKEETKAEVESPEKDAASDGGNCQTSPTLSKNSYDATKEEIEDSINFIKNRLSVADPKIPGGTMNEENIKKADEEPQPSSERAEDTNKEHGETNLVVKKEEIEKEIPKEEIKIPETNTEVEKPKTNTEVTKKDPDVNIL